MNFGEILRKNRLEEDLSVNKLADYSNVSNAYISKLENGKRNFPSLPYIFNIVAGFKRHYKEKNDNLSNWSDFVETDTAYLLDTFLNADDSNLDEEQKESAYDLFDSFYEELLNKRLSYNKTISNDIFQNKVEVNSNGTKIETLNKPYYDLAWLLTQKEYKVFFGRDFIFEPNIYDPDHLSPEEMFFYNTLNSEDLETIYKIIQVFLENKYSKINDSERFFEEVTNEENVKKINFDIHEFVSDIHYEDL
ncbi:helix-turn-helix domain-containing protein [Macrococcus bovicus]|uniref:helix-turn-helix domain-containing protein n=1 Tax=Macrococcus bovicus TaxID=69968 RepID=UPI0025A55CCC|nr:helix-turn-helix domain-containing protein [Macrococcus bovicus]WJP98436.1 helix-turn-helix domain-containing protein [Macrococcus bovicus]